MTAALVDALLANVRGRRLRRRSAWRRTRSSVADSIALGVGLTLCGWVFTGTALIAAQLTASTRSMYGIAGAVIGVAYVLRAIGDVGSARPDLALADRVVPGHARVLRPALVAGPAPARRRRGRDGRRRTPCSSGATSAPASWPPARARTARAPGCAARSAWPGTSSAASVIGWAAGLFLHGAGLRLDRRRRRRPGRRLRDHPGGVPPGRRPTWSTGFYATALLMLALIACGFAISSALRPRGEEDGGTGRVAAGDRPARRDWLLGHVAVTVLGRRRGARAGRPRVSASAMRWSPATATPSSATCSRCCRTSRPCWCCPAWPGCWSGCNPRLGVAGLAAAGAGVRGDVLRRPAAACRSGCRTSRRSSTSRWCRPRTSRGRRSWPCALVAAALSAAGQVALRSPRRPLNGASPLSG